MIQHSEFYKKIKNRYTLMDGVLLLFLICILSYICYLNFTKFDFNIDSDIINEIQYRKESWLQKTPYPQGFVCSSESFANRPFLIYWLFYAITGDFIFSYQCELITTLLISVLLLYVFLRNLRISRTGSLLGVCLLLVMLPTEEKIIVFQFLNAYVVFVWVILLTLILRYQLGKVLWEQDGAFYTKAWARYFAGMLLISCLIGFTTFKMLLFLYGPLFLIDSMRVVWRFINHRQIHANHLVMATVTGLVLLGNICAYILFTLLYGETIGPSGLEMASITAWTDWSVLSAQLQSLLASLGDFANTSATTMALSCIFAFFEFIVIIWFVVHRRECTYAQQTDLFLYWYMSTAAIFFSQVFLGSAVFNTRYFLLPALIILLLCACAVDRWSEWYSTWLRHIPRLALLIGLVVVAVNIVKGDTKNYRDAPKPVLESVAEYIQDNGYSYVTATYWNAGVITGLTNGAVESQHTMDIDPINFYPFNWLIDTRKFTDERPGVPNIILLTDEEEQKALEGNGRMALLLEKEAIKVAEIENYNLYEMTINPFCALDSIEAKYGPSLPTDTGTSKEVTYTSGGFSTQNGVLQEDGSIRSDGTAGSVIYGPYEQTMDGTYEITLHYQIISYENEDNAVFDIAIDQESLYQSSLNKEQAIAKLSNVKMENGHQFEVRVYVPEGMIIQIKSIEYAKIS